MKKLLLGLGSIAATIAPIAAVISCGDNSRSVPHLDNTVIPSPDGGNGQGQQGVSGPTVADMEVAMAKVNAAYTSTKNSLEVERGAHFNAIEGDADLANVGVTALSALMVPAEATLKLVVKTAYTSTTGTYQLKVWIENDNDNTVKTAEKTVTVTVPPVSLIDSSQAWHLLFKGKNQDGTSKRVLPPAGTKVSIQLRNSNDVFVHTITNDDRTALQAFVDGTMDQNAVVDYMAEQLVAEAKKLSKTITVSEVKERFNVTGHPSPHAFYMNNTEAVSRFNGQQLDATSSLVSEFYQELHEMQGAVQRDIKGQLPAELGDAKTAKAKVADSPTVTSTLAEPTLDAQTFYNKVAKANTYDIAAGFTKHGNAVFFLKAHGASTVRQAITAPTGRKQILDPTITGPSFFQYGFGADFGEDAATYLKTHKDVIGMLAFYNSRAGLDGETTSYTHRVFFTDKLRDDNTDATADGKYTDGISIDGSEAAANMFELKYS